MPEAAARSAEAAKKAQDGTERTGQAAMNAAGKTAKEAIGQAGEMTEHATDEARDMTRTAAEQFTETAEMAAEVSSKAADQGRDAMMMGVRTAAGVSGRIADISYGRSHHLLASAVHVMDVYRDAAERSADRLQALFASYLTLGRGIQQMQHAWLEMLDHTMESASHKPQDLLRCNNVVELAEVQRELYLDSVHHAFDTTSRLLEMAGKTVQNAARPMETARH